LRKSSAAEVSARVEGLIVLPCGLLSGDWRHFSLDALAAVIRIHGVTIDWLLGSASGSWAETTHRGRAWEATNIEPEALS
jgi:hypothetical protein